MRGSDGFWQIAAVRLPLPRNPPAPRRAEVGDRESWSTAL